MSKTKIFGLAAIAGVAAAVSRAVYLQVATRGFSEYDFVMAYGHGWSTWLPLSVAVAAIMGFLMVPSVALMSKSFTAKI